MLWQFTVGLRVERQADRIVVDAEDALIDVRRLNRRGDTRHPPHTLTGGR